MDFVGGFNDGFTPTGWITRNATGAMYGYYGVDEESDAYFYGEVSGTVAGFLVPGAKGVKTYANAVDGAGDCANWLSTSSQSPKDYSNGKKWMAKMTTTQHSFFAIHFLPQHPRWQENVSGTNGVVHGELRDF